MGVQSVGVRSGKSHTNDGWVYCCGCHKGFPTSGIWTSLPLIFYDKHGPHCCMCRGYGKRDGVICDECLGVITQPIDEE